MKILLIPGIKFIINGIIRRIEMLPTKNVQVCKQFQNTVFQNFIFFNYAKKVYALEIMFFQIFPKHDENEKILSQVQYPYKFHIL